MIFRVAYTFLCYCAVLEGVPQRGVGHHRQHRSWSVRGGPGEHWAAEVRLGDGDHGDSEDNRDNITVTMRIVMIIVTTVMVIMRTVRIIVTI